MPAIGNAAYIPHHLDAGVEIGGDDGQHAAVPVFFGDARHDFFVDVSRDQPAERLRIV